jgi:hypothetical protein
VEELETWTQLAHLFGESVGFQISYVIEQLCKCSLADDDIGIATWSRIFKGMADLSDMVVH